VVNYNVPILVQADGSASDVSDVDHCCHFFLLRSLMCV
jgi:hypothetical protein